MRETTWYIDRQKMKVVALVSGGKDSCYNMMKCVEAGHEIIALANLQPHKQDELDSYMFQTVGHEGISLYAEAMELPLYRTTTQGHSVSRELQYSPTEGDEVEDLYELLCRVKEELNVEAVSSGAVLSDYQRLRVENVCSRLGLVSLAYLWRRDQSELLQEMIAAGVNAVVIKVAAMGLSPEKHLGKKIKQLYPEVVKLHEQYGINVCGEGGEYETYTLDCPLFKKQIVIDDSEIIVHSADAFAPVAYLKLKQLQLKEKEEVQKTAVLSSSFHSSRRLNDACSLCLKPVLTTDIQSQNISSGTYSWLSWNGNQTLSSVDDQTQDLFGHLENKLSKSGYCLQDVVLVYLYLADLRTYPTVNSVYSNYFLHKPPARVCVAMSLPRGVHVRVEVMVWRCEDGRRSMHVQSHSEWAPANIGPYSQAYTVSDIVFLAGQIGLIPVTMALAEPSEQAPLSFAHVQTILNANRTNLSSAIFGVCYYTSDEHGWRAKHVWSKFLASIGVQCGCPLAFLQVPALPRGACVEWHYVAVKEPHVLTYSLQPPFYLEGFGLFSMAESWCKELQIGCWMCTITCLDCDSNEAHFLGNVVQQGLKHVNRMLSKYQIVFSQLSCLRVCVPAFGLGNTLKCEDVLQVCAEFTGSSDKVIPISFVTMDNFLGHKTEIILQAAIIHM